MSEEWTRFRFIALLASSYPQVCGDPLWGSPESVKAMQTAPDSWFVSAALFIQVRAQGGLTPEAGDTHN